MRFEETLEKLDSSTPQSVLCCRCHTPVNESTAPYGRYAANWFTKSTLEVEHLVTPQGQLVIIPIVKEKRFPKLVKGFFCESCRSELWAITWRDKNGHLRHAIDILHAKPGEIVQPRNDDYEASKVTKGLYAPHGGRGSYKSAVIHSDREDLLKNPEDMTIKPRRRFHKKPKVKVIMRRGKMVGGRR